MEEVVSYARQLRPDAIVIAGDIYDKTVPSAEAVTVFDHFLTEVSKLSIPVLAISGNHDSARRLEFAGEILRNNQIYLIGTPPQTETEWIVKVPFQDCYGEVCFYLLPFLKPGYVKGVFQGEIPESYDAAVRKLLERERLSDDVRNVLVAHQFFTGSSGEQPETCDSEIFSIGGIDNVCADAVKAFDYVALGHLHGAQRVGEERRCV